jgi:hypothetical protein
LNQLYQPARETLTAVCRDWTSFGDSQSVFVKLLPPSSTASASPSFCLLRLSWETNRCVPPLYSQRTVIGPGARRKRGSLFEFIFYLRSFVVAHLSFFARPAERRSALRNLKRRINEAKVGVRTTRHLSFNKNELVSNSNAGENENGSQEKRETRQFGSFSKLFRPIVVKYEPKDVADAREGSLPSLNAPTVPLLGTYLWKKRWVWPIPEVTLSSTALDWFACGGLCFKRFLKFSFLFHFDTSFYTQDDTRAAAAKLLMAARLRDHFLLLTSAPHFNLVKVHTTIARHAHAQRTR